MHFTLRCPSVAPPLRQESTTACSTCARYSVTICAELLDLIPDRRHRSQIRVNSAKVGRLQLAQPEPRHRARTFALQLRTAILDVSPVKLEAAEKILLAPLADAGFQIGRDIRTSDLAADGVEQPAAGEQFAIARVPQSQRGMAGHAACYR